MALPLLRVICWAVIVAWWPAQTVASAVRLEPSPIPVAGLRLSLKAATITLDDGAIYPARTADGRPAEFVFIGTGRVTMSPVDALDRHQLELFTGAEVLDEVFHRAVLTLTVEAAAEAILERPRAAPDRRRLEVAQALFDRWHRSRERELLDVEARLFLNALHDPLGVGFFAGLFEGRRLGRFMCVVDQLAWEQVTVGQFYRPQLTRRQARRARRHLERAQQRGKLIGVEIGDLGIWDTWVSSHLAIAGTAVPGTAGVEARHYIIDATLSADELALSAIARIELEVLVDGLRGVIVSTSPELEVHSVANGSGGRLSFRRSHGELAVELGAPVAAGDRVTLEIAYSGRPVERIGNGVWVQRDSLSWYPHAGHLDRATYDVTLRWPAGLDLVASGLLVDSGAERGLRWQRRSLPTPSLGFGFEVGTFEQRSARVGEVEVVVAVDPVAAGVGGDLPDQMLSIVVQALEFFTDLYGPLQHRRLAVVSSPRTLSQGLPGLLVISAAALVEPDIWAAVLGIEDRRALIAHELAHQWWGNQVGWQSYRDQWISEAMATYSALLFTRKLERELGDTVLRGPTAGWKEELLAVTAQGRTVESLGPPVLGERLMSSQSSSAYQTIVYKKGAVVLDMLSRLFPAGGFERILRGIAEVAANRVISTGDFVSAVERLGGVDLEWFAARFIRGTGLPAVIYSYELQPIGEGRWSVTGQARMRTPDRASWRVVEQNGKLTVRRETAAPRQRGEPDLVVPIQIGVGPSAGAGDRVVLGQVLLEGEHTRFRLEVEHEPRLVWLDRDQEVLAQFLCRSRWPRQAGLQLGRELVAAGELDRAESVLRAALEEPVVIAPPGWLDLNEERLERQGRALLARIHTSLARLYLDQGRPDQAEVEVDRADRAVRRSRRRRVEDELVLVRARLDLDQARPERAYRSLRRLVRRGDGPGPTEGLALLAVAAHLTGKTDELRLACNEAARRGVDLGPLHCPVPAS
jgi:hypothetical protein